MTLKSARKREVSLGSVFFVKGELVTVFDVALVDSKSALPKHFSISIDGIYGSLRDSLFLVQSAKKCELIVKLDKRFWRRGKNGIKAVFSSEVNNCLEWFETISMNFEFSHTAPSSNFAWSLANQHTIDLD